MSLETIKAEIKALKIHCDLLGIEDLEEQTRVIGHNSAIDNALDIIDSHIEPKDEPTEAGLWQCTKNGANHIIDVAEDLTYPKYCKGGQWEKVRL